MAVFANVTFKFFIWHLIWIEDFSKGTCNSEKWQILLNAAVPSTYQRKKIYSTHHIEIWIISSSPGEKLRCHCGPLCMQLQSKKQVQFSHAWEVWQIMIYLGSWYGAQPSHPAQSGGAWAGVVSLSLRFFAELGEAWGRGNSYIKTPLKS